ncbi:MAG: PorV/PorQ family protein [Candidatus Zixiibacteriota bacterium]|nr:MAG: PorV/PorQ family protein [candidate division Zixibacteria bacterium]
MNKKTAVLFAILVLIGFNSGATSEDGGYAGAFLKMTVDAKPAGMGGAYVAVSNEGAGQLHNPAGVQTLTKTVLNSSYRAMKLGRKMGFVSLLFPTRLESALGISWLYAGYGEVERRDGSGYTTGGTISSNEHVFAISFAKRFIPFLGLGTKLNYYHKNVGDVKANSIGVNVGAVLFVDSLYRYGSMEGKFITDINAGLVVNNIAAQYPWETQSEGLSATKTDDFPVVVGLGVSCRALERKLLVAVDAEKNAKQSALVRFGGEYILRDNFLLRAGLNDGTISAGAGFKFDLEKLLLSVDYAFSGDRAGAGEDHIFSFELRF